MRTMRYIVLSLLMVFVMEASGQRVADEVEWYLDEVVSEVFVRQNDFEYYYVPSAADVAQQREKGEVSYFLNTPGGLNRKKTCDLIDRLMSSYDDIKAVGDWHMTSTTYWKEFRHEKNRFRFSVKRKALDDGTYYVSVTESANYYKSLGKKNKRQGTESVSQKSRKRDEAETRSTRRGRKSVVVADGGEQAEADVADADAQPVMSAKERRQALREKKEAEELAERARVRRAQEQRREEAKAQKEAEKLKKAEEKKQKEEEKRLKKEEERKQREEARRERDQQRREKETAKREAARKESAKAVESRYHYTDVALWLSEKYDFTQTSSGPTSCTMFSSAVKDVEMAKLAIKNALKGSNARMAVPWRENGETQAIETGYTVDSHVLVFSIGKRDDGNILISITEVSGEEFERFKQAL